MTYAQLAGLLEVFASSEAPRATCALKVPHGTDSCVCVCVRVCVLVGEGAIWIGGVEWSGVVCDIGAVL